MKFLICIDEKKSNGRKTYTLIVPTHDTPKEQSGPVQFWLQVQVVVSVL